MEGPNNTSANSNWESNSYQVVNDVNVETSYSSMKDPAIIHANDNVTPVSYPLDGQSITGEHHTGYSNEPVVVTEGYSTGYQDHYQGSGILNEAYGANLPLEHYDSGNQGHSTGYDHNLLVDHYPNNAAINHGTDYQQNVPVQHYDNNQLNFAIDQNLAVDQHYGVIEHVENAQLTGTNFALGTRPLTDPGTNETLQDVNNPTLMHEAEPVVKTDVVTKTEEEIQSPEIQLDIKPSLVEDTPPPIDNPVIVPHVEELIIPEFNEEVEERYVEEKVPETPAQSVLNESETIPKSINEATINVAASTEEVGVECIDLILPVVSSAAVTMDDPVALRTTSGNVNVSEKEEKVVNIPPHMLGQTLDNPTEDVGRAAQKPRFGVKVPSRNLMSSIVSKDELAHEVAVRGERTYDVPQGGDIFFAQKLTKRLASRLSGGAKASDSAAAAKKEAPKAVKEPANVGDEDLLAILEGDVEDWTIDRPPPQLIEAAKSPASNHSDPPKLDRAVERELALRQLSTMPSSRKPKKDAAAKAPTPPPVLRRIRPEQGAVQATVPEPVPGSSKSIPLRKRKIPEEALADVETVKQENNGEASAPSLDSVEPEKKTTVKEPRIFKTKRQSLLTNGKKEAEPKPLSLAVKKPKLPDEVRATVTSPPPRTYSSRIKKSTYNDDFVFPSTSKSRAIPVVGKTQQAVVVNQTTAEKPAAKPSIKKLPVKAAKPLTVEKVKEKVVKPAAKSAKKTPKKLTEVDRLLMDEGAINMLYAVEKDEEQRRAPGGSPVEVGPKKRVLKSARYSHKDLLMKTRLVKNAVQRLKNEPGQDSPSTTLRGKRSSVAPMLSPAVASKPPTRKTSLDSSASLDPGSPTQVFTYPPRLHPPAEASRIIRRHSSSSNFSSRSASPTGARSGADVDQVETVRKKARKRGNPIFIHKLDSQTPKSKKKKKGGTDDSIFQASTEDGAQIDKEELKSQMAKNFQQVVSQAKSRTKKAAPPPQDAVANGLKTTGSEEVTACLAEAVTAFIADDGNVDRSSLPPELPKQSLAAVSAHRPDPASCLNSLVLRLELDCTRRAERSKERCSLRQAAAAMHFNSLRLRHHDNLVQLELAPLDPQLVGALNAQVLHELSDALQHLGKDESCRAVLLTSSCVGSGSFCAGIDLPCLLVEDPEHRRAAAVEMAAAIKRLIGTIARFEKPVVAAVQGATVGLGVTLLAHLDMTYASEDATFQAPYARLGQVAEAGAVVTLPSIIGHQAASELLLAGRIFTAAEAKSCGLIARVLDTDNFLDNVLSLASSVAKQSSQSMEATKALMRCHSLGQLEAALEAESRLLVQHWTSSECQSNIRLYLDEVEARQ